MKLILPLLIILTLPTRAAIIEWRALWSGQPYGNTAAAEAFILIDTDLWNAATTDYETASLTASGILGLDLTITGAATGNGTFTEADFDLYQWDTLGFTLDLAQELRGQALGSAFWGVGPSGESGDFNLISGLPASPTGTDYFELTTAGGTGDPMRLTSISPIPEPSVAWLLAALPGWILLRRGRAG